MKMIVVLGVWLLLQPATWSQSDAAVELSIYGVESGSFPAIALYATVTEDGLPLLAALPPDAFALTEDGYPVTDMQVTPFTRFDRDTAAVLVLDHRVAASRQAALAMVDHLPPHARYRIALITLEDAECQHEFTADFDALRACLEALPDVAQAERGASAREMSDALEKALQLFEEDGDSRNHQRILYILHANSDPLPDTKLLAFVAQAHRLTVPIYPIALNAPANASLETLAAETNGLSYQHVIPKTISPILANIFARLHTGYHIAFTSRAPADNAVHRLVLHASVGEAHSTAQAAFIAATSPVQVTLTSHALNGRVAIVPQIQSDASITHIALKINGALVQEALSRALQYQWDTTQETPGNYILGLTARDRAGHIGGISEVFHVANAVTLTITAPEPGAIVDGYVPVEFVVGGDLASLNNVTLLADGQVAESMIAPETRSNLLEWDATSASPGTHTLTVRAHSATVGAVETSVQVHTPDALAPNPNAALSGLVKTATIDPPIDIQIAAFPQATSPEALPPLEFAFAGRPADVQNLMILVNGVPQITQDDFSLQEGTNAVALPVEGFSLGEQHIEVRVWDTHGEMHSETITTFVGAVATATRQQEDSGLYVELVSPPDICVNDVVPIRYVVAGNFSVLKQVTLHADGKVLDTSTEAQGVFNWDCANVPKGSHVLEVVAHTHDGDTSARSQHPIHVERPITVEVISPQPDQPVSGPVEVTYQITGGIPNDIQEAVLLVDDREVASDTEPEPGTNTLRWNAQSFAQDQAYTLTVRLNHMVVSEPVRVYLVPSLKIEITAPEDQAQVDGKGMVAVDYTTYAAAAVTDITLWVNGTLINSDSVDTSRPAPAAGTLFWDAASVPQGDYTLQVTANDRLGHQVSDSVRIRVARHGTIIVVEPGHETTVAGAISVRFSLDGVRPADVAEVAFLVNDQKEQALTGIQSHEGTFGWDTQKLSTGTYTLTIDATDTLGQSFQGTVTVYVEEPISVEIVAPGTDGVLHVTPGKEEQPITVHYRTEARTAALQSVRLEVDGMVVDSMDEAPPPEGTLTWSAQEWASGEHTLSVWAVDAKGHSAGASTPLAILRPIEVRFLNPEAGEHVAQGSVRLRFELVGGIKDIGQVILQADGEDFAALDNVSPGIHELYWLAETVGPHTLSVFVYNAAGDMTTRDDLRLMVSELLRVTLLAPEDNASVIGEIPIAYEVTSPVAETTLARAVLAIDNEAVHEVYTPEMCDQLSWPVGDLAPGAHKVTLRVEDDAGHGAEALVTVYVVAPSVVPLSTPLTTEQPEATPSPQGWKVTIVEPETGAQLYSPVTVRYQVDAPADEIKRVALMINKTEVEEAFASLDTTTFTWDTSMSGDFTFQILVYDQAGAVHESARVTAEVLPQDQTKSQTFLIVFAVVIVIVLISVYFSKNIR